MQDFGNCKCVHILFLFHFNSTRNRKPQTKQGKTNFSIFSNNVWKDAFSTNERNTHNTLSVFTENNKLSFLFKSNFPCQKKKLLANNYLEKLYLRAYSAFHHTFHRGLLLLTLTVQYYTFEVYILARKGRKHGFPFKLPLSPSLIHFLSAYK